MKINVAVKEIDADIVLVNNTYICKSRVAKRAVKKDARAVNKAARVAKRAVKKDARALNRRIKKATPSAAARAAYQAKKAAKMKKGRTISLQEKAAKKKNVKKLYK